MINDFPRKNLDEPREPPPQPNWLSLALTLGLSIWAIAMIIAMC